MPCLVLEAATTLVLRKLEDFHSVTVPDEAPVQEEVEVQHHPHHHLILCCQVNLVDMCNPGDIFYHFFLILFCSVQFWVFLCLKLSIFYRRYCSKQESRLIQNAVQPPLSPTIPSHPHQYSFFATKFSPLNFRILFCGVNMLVQKMYLMKCTTI